LKDDQQKFIDATVSGIRSGKKRLLAEMTAWSDKTWKVIELRNYQPPGFGFKQGNRQDPVKKCPGPSGRGIFLRD
jgi:hypothetical protein